MRIQGGFIVNRKERYRDLSLWRKTCDRQRKKYYAKTAIYPPQRWTVEEDRMVLEHKMTDSQLSRIIHHSVKAIQVRRSRLTHNTKSAAVLPN